MATPWESLHPEMVRVTVLPPHTGLIRMERTPLVRDIEAAFARLADLQALGRFDRLLVDMYDCFPLTDGHHALFQAFVPIFNRWRLRGIALYDSPYQVHRDIVVRVIQGFEQAVECPFAIFNTEAEAKTWLNALPNLPNGEAR